MGDTLRLADHFPRQPKPCRAVAQTFFACFTAKGEQPPEGVSHSRFTFVEHHSKTVAFALSVPNQGWHMRSVAQSGAVAVAAMCIPMTGLLTQLMCPLMLMVNTMI